MSAGNEEMNRRIFEAAGRTRVARLVPEMPDANRVLNDRILAAAGRLPAEPPASTIPEEADAFTREAMTLGVPGDLVDVARSIVPSADELSGASLRSALTKAIGERPSLAPDFEARMEARLNGLDGGAGRNARRENPAPSMTDMILVATGRKASTYKAPNGITLERGAD